MYNETLDLILEKKLIVILRNVEESKLIPLQDALYAQGVQCIEVTFDQKRPDGVEATARAIRMLKEHRSEMAVGAGTVLTEAQLDAAFAAGGSACPFGQQTLCATRPDFQSGTGSRAL